ncbi:MAG: Ku protein [Gemmatimonadota bacterium]|nr:Ku protein [Gemmatimonadota bacterium]
MAARAIWKGVIRFGEVSLPVKLYSAVEDRSIHFRLLHEPDLVPVRQRMVHPGTGETVPYEETRRGVETERGMVVLDEEDLESLEPESSREIEIVRFVPGGEIDHRWYRRPYWLGPDGTAPEYASLATALEQRGLEGVARWTMRNKEYHGALRVREGRLLLVTLRHAGEVVSMERLEAPSGREPTDSEMEMAGKLVDALSGEWEPEAYENEYRARVLELVEAKAEGKVVAFEPVRREEPKESLEEALEASLQRIEEERASA